MSKILANLAVDGSYNATANKDDGSLGIRSLNISDPCCNAGDHVTKVRACLRAIALKLGELKTDVKV